MKKQQQQQIFHLLKMLRPTNERTIKLRLVIDDLSLHDMVQFADQFYFNTFSTLNLRTQPDIRIKMLGGVMKTIEHSE